MDEAQRKANMYLNLWGELPEERIAPQEQTQPPRKGDNPVSRYLQSLEDREKNKVQSDKAPAKQEHKA
jgi:hypothetical protein